MLFKSSIRVVAAAVLCSSFAAVSHAQNPGGGRWASADDPDAKAMIEMERKFAVLECEPSNVVAEALADDFVGTAPEGPLYTKRDALGEKPESAGSVHGCKLLSAKVRFYGDALAILYGKETSIRKDSNGKVSSRTLIWTDTWLKRNGKWQIIAAQDMKDPEGQ